MFQYGFRGKVNDFLCSYLSDRLQYVNCSDCCSDTLDISVGVPQGSILGPLLFNIFINDITFIPDCKKILYADDAVFYVSDADFNLCVDKLRVLIENIETWTLNNKLIVNIDKSKLMLLTPKSNPVLPTVYFNGNELEWVDSIRYLGLQLDNKLKFNFHYNKVIQSLSKYVGIFYSISNYTPRSALISIFNSLVLPVLYQNIIIWGYLPQYQINKINIKMNRILRCILGVRFDDFFQPSIPTNNMYKMLNILKFKDLYNLSLLKFLHFILYKRPKFFEFYFSHL